MELELVSLPAKFHMRKGNIDQLAIFGTSQMVSYLPIHNSFSFHCLPE